MLNMPMAPICRALVANPDVKPVFQQQNRQQTAHMSVNINVLEPYITIKKLHMHEQHRGALSGLQKGERNHSSQIKVDVYP
jgi:hypothetical protein